MRSGRKHNPPPVDVGRREAAEASGNPEGAPRVDDSSPPPLGALSYLLPRIAQTVILVNARWVTFLTVSQRGTPAG
jgi:hypothetical protein